MKVLGVGTDITECLRIAQMIERHGELFVGRVYTPLEIEYCRSRRMATQHFAGRWAAKEAVLKALGTGWCILVSISHCRSHATAYAVALDEVPSTFMADPPWL
ncbi:MAG: holo-ACP synthase [Planctomycetaceae bacterium]|nr:holo-ACP synthase [Planctomycetaceae bacterium]